MPNRTRRAGVVQGALSQRRERARQSFVNLCQRTALMDLLGRERSWAIVGGAVRDTLLIADINVPYWLDSWPDIDVAVSDDVRQLPVVTDPPQYSNFEVSHNSFGGFRVEEPTIGVVDLWTWSDEGTSSDSTDKWLEKLTTIDFGLNAVCFAWPQAQVVIHPRWIHDLEARKVEKLFLRSPRREIQVVRAVALQTKLQALTGQPFTLGRLVREDLRWLTVEADSSQVVSAINYLVEKTRTARWPMITLREFTSAVAHFELSAGFRAAVAAISHQIAEGGGHIKQR